MSPLPILLVTLDQSLLDRCIAAFEPQVPHPIISVDNLEDARGLLSSQAFACLVLDVASDYAITTWSAVEILCFIEAVRERVPILALTESALAQDRDAWELRYAGCYRVIEPPAEISTLIVVIQETIQAGATNGRVTLKKWLPGGLIQALCQAFGLDEKRVHGYDAVFPSANQEEPHFFKLDFELVFNDLPDLGKIQAEITTYFRNKGYRTEQQGATTVVVQGNFPHTTVFTPCFGNNLVIFTVH